jgi:hypothetical protein
VRIGSLVTGDMVVRRSTSMVFWRDGGAGMAGGGGGTREVPSSGHFNETDVADPPVSPHFS